MKYIVIICFLLISNLSFYGQSLSHTVSLETIDSLWSNGSTQEALETSRLLKIKAIDSKDSVNMYKVCRLIGVYNCKYGYYDEALQNFNMALLVCNGLKDELNKLDVLLQMSVVYRIKASYKKCLLSLKKCLDILLNKDNCSEQKALVYCQIALVNLELGNSSKALAYLNKSLMIYEESQNIEGILTILNNKGLVCLRLNDLDNALRYVFRSLDLNINSENHRYCSYGYLGAIYLEKGKYELSKTYFLKQLAFSREMNDRENILCSLEYLSRVYSCLSEFCKSRKCLSEANVIAFDLNSMSKRIDVLKSYRFLYSKLKDLDNVNQCNKDISDLQDNLMMKETRALASSLELNDVIGKIDKLDVKKSKLLYSEIKLHISYSVVCVCLLFFILIIFLLYKKEYRLRNSLESYIELIRRESSNILSSVDTDILPEIILMTNISSNTSVTKCDKAGILYDRVVEKQHLLNINTLVEYGLREAIQDTVDYYDIPRSVNVKIALFDECDDMDYSIKYHFLNIIFVLINHSLRYDDLNDILILFAKQKNGLHFCYADDAFIVNENEDSYLKYTEMLNERLKMLDAEVFVRIAHNKGAQLEINIPDYVSVNLNT